MEPIVDAHHHIWRHADQPWLQGPAVPRIFGEYEGLRRDYPAEDFIADLKDTGVVKSVYVQTNWLPNREVEEVEYVQESATRTGWPHAIVSFVNFQSEDAPKVMDAQAKASKLMRGARQQLHWHENQQYRFAPTPDQMNTPMFRNNFALLADRGWLFELQVFASQMADGAALAKAFPAYDLGAGACRHAGGPFAGRPQGLARRHEAARRRAQHEYQILRARHLHPP